MPIASFNLKDIKAMVEKAKIAAQNHGVNPTMSLLFDGSLYPGGEPLDKDGMTEADHEAKDSIFWPC